MYLRFFCFKVLGEILYSKYLIILYFDDIWMAKIVKSKFRRTRKNLTNSKEFTLIFYKMWNYVFCFLTVSILLIILNLILKKSLEVELMFEAIRHTLFN